jgi:hypothetical protein
MRDWGVYCINGIARGYLKSSPFGALTLAIIIQMTLRTTRKMIIGIPTRIKHKGITSIIYRSIDNWKLRDALPLSFTHEDSSLFVNQQISGPITPPNGKKKPAKAER